MDSFQEGTSQKPVPKNEFFKAVINNPLTDEESMSFYAAKKQFLDDIKLWQNIGVASGLFLYMSRIKRFSSMTLVTSPAYGALFGGIIGSVKAYNIIEKVPDQGKMNRIFKDFKFNIPNLALLYSLGRTPVEASPAPKNIPQPKPEIKEKAKLLIKPRQPIIDEEEEEDENLQDFNYKLYGSDISAWDRVRNSSFSKQSSWERVRQRESASGSFDPNQVLEPQLGRWEQIREENKIRNRSDLGTYGSSSSSQGRQGESRKSSWSSEDGDGAIKRNKYGDVINY